MIRVRRSVLADLEAIRDVSVRNGLSGFDPEERKRWWLSHPFREEFEGVPIGWVLENDGGEIVGTFSNIHMMYEMDGKRFKCGIAGSWGVDTAHRNSSMLLAMSYFSQKGVDFCFSGSASSVASRLMPVLKAQRIPSEDYDISYFWITNYRAFAEAVLRKKNVPPARVLSHAVGLGLKVVSPKLGNRKRGSAKLKRFTSFGGEFDQFWNKLRQGSGRLRAVRASTALEWRFGGALRQGKAVVLGLLRGEELIGYVVLFEKDREHLRLRQYVIADLQALDDSAETILDLLTEAIEATREERLAALEWQGWNAAKRQLAALLKPKRYHYPVWPIFYKAAHPDLVRDLARGQSWDFSPFDAF